MLRNPPQLCSAPLAFLIILAATASCSGQEVELLRLEPDPFGYPRPADGQASVPVATSLYFELRATDPEDSILTESVQLTLFGTGDDSRPLLRAPLHFDEGTSGQVQTAENWRAKAQTVSIYLEPGRPLAPATRYTARAEARTRKGGTLSPDEGTWFFTTDDLTTAPRPVVLTLDLTTAPVTWRGGFFTGWCKPGFCTSSVYDRLPAYELMRKARSIAPRAWSLQRDWHPTGTEYAPRFLPMFQPNVVRERETRRIAAMETISAGVALHVEDFFGCTQYGIPPGRSIASDYAPGDEVIVADPDRSSTATVVRVDVATSTVVVNALPPVPPWKLAYTSPLPGQERPEAPGLFAPGGCHLLKSRPAGTPHYYWGRMDRELDLVAGRFGHRQVVSLCEAPGDLSRDGRPGNTAKDYVQLHGAVREITGHLIDRYGDRCLDWTWSILNEPDLGALFFRAAPEEIERFYDYAADAVLRAFEDRGYDSDRVFIGGLELGILERSQGLCERFLAHCSPAAGHPAALKPNSAFADRRLDGRRSRRTEVLCRASGGRGAPLDFLSVHCYNSSEKTAAKLRQAKEIALRVDPETYADLWINTHESCPDWAPPGDPAASDSYLGNGFFSTWCADVVRRQLAAAAADARFGFGESILTFWPWTASNLRGAPDAFHAVNVDDNGDGRKDRSVTFPMPVYHLLNFVAAMGPEFRVLSETAPCGSEGGVVSGFASRDDSRIRAVIYAHQEKDIQSRSALETTVSLQLHGLKPGSVRITVQRIGRGEGSLYQLIEKGKNTLLPVSASQASGMIGRGGRLPENILAARADVHGQLHLPLPLSANSAILLTVEEAER